PQGRVGHVVVRAVEDLRRDVEHPHLHAVLVAGPGALLVRGRAVRVAERGADPGHFGLGRDGRQSGYHPGDHAAAAAHTRQRAVGAELVRNRTAVGRHQDPLLHNEAGYRWVARETLRGREGGPRGVWGDGSPQSRGFRGVVPPG